MIENRLFGASYEGHIRHLQVPLGRQMTFLGIEASLYVSNRDFEIRKTLFSKEIWSSLMKDEGCDPKFWQVMAFI